MPLILLILLLCFAGAAPAQQIDLSRWFPFNPSGPVAAGSAADASDLLLDIPGENAAGTIERRGRVVARPDGHFYFEKTGRRTKFFGTNFTFSTSFPANADAPVQATSDLYGVPQDAAEQLATRVQRMGVNLVRFHHMDNQNRPSGIWDPAYPNDTQHLDPVQLRRLDYLIYQLKQRGVYTNLNLHVSRQFRRDDGVPAWDKFNGSYNTPATQFDPIIINLEKKYADALLGHMNPYTGLRLADDPAVAFVEITNEDSLMYAFNNDIVNYDPARATLPQYYSDELDRMWNQWLQARYGADGALAQAWQSSGSDSPNALSNPGFESGLTGWSQNLSGGTVTATFGTTGSDKQEGSNSAQISVTKVDGTNWHIQLIQGGLSLVAGQTYELSFWAVRTDIGKPKIEPIFQRDGTQPNQYAVYASLGSFQPGFGWTQYSVTFRSNYTDAGHVNLVFNLGGSDPTAGPATMLIDKVVFRAIAPSGLGSSESLAAGTVIRPAHHDLGRYCDARSKDLVQFYFETERGFFQEMARYIHEDLGSRALVTGTAPYWFYLGDTEAQTGLDFLDGHEYFDHPWWSGVAAWSQTGWKINNASFATKEPAGFMFNLAAGAVSGKPYTVSEFNQPFPNDYQAEGLLWMSTYGNFHDWDEVLEFDYGPGPDQYLTDVSRGFFQVAGNTIKAAEMPVVSRIFIGSQNSVAAGRLELTAGHDELMQAGPSLNAKDYFSKHGVNAATALQTGVRTGRFAAGNAADYSLSAAPPAVLVSDNKEITYDKSASSAPYLQVASASLNALCGFIGGKTITLPAVTVALAAWSPGFASVTLQPIDRRTLDSSERVLLTVLTRMQNTGMVWNADRTSVDNNWGSAPVLIEPASGTITLRLKPGVNYHVYPLDSSGNRRGEAGSGRDQFNLNLDTAAQQTVWYEIVADDASVQKPSVNQGGVVNAADYTKAIAPGSLVSIYGTNLAASAFFPQTFPLPLSGGDASVLIGGQPAPLLYAGPLQINAQVPWGLAEGQSDVRVLRGANISAPEPVPIHSVGPAIFATVPYAPRPDCNCVRAGDYVLVFATGLGALSGDAPAGLPAGAVWAQAEVKATIGGIPAIVTYAGTAPYYSGLNQVNVVVPAGVPAGQAPLVISAAGRDSNAFTLTIGQ